MPLMLQGKWPNVSLPEEKQMGSLPRGGQNGKRPSDQLQWRGASEKNLNKRKEV